MPGSSAIRAVAALLCCWAFSLPLAPGWAGEARIVAASGPDRVVIEARDASVDEVLEILAGRFGFAVEQHARPGQSVRYSGPLRGSLDQLLERLLRHEEHIVVRSAETRAGVGRVILLDAKGGAPVAAKDGPPASTARDPHALSLLSTGFPSKAKLQLPQLWSGLE